MIMDLHAARTRLVSHTHAPRKSKGKILNFTSFLTEFSIPHIMSSILNTFEAKKCSFVKIFNKKCPKLGTG